MRGLGAILVISAAGLSPALADGTTFSCQRDNVTRKVEIAMTPDPAAACEVRYDKSAEGEPARVLWRAASDPVFCKEKAEALVSRLADGGWTCESSMTSAMMEEMPSGVTAAIAPRGGGEPDDMSIEGRQTPPAPEMRGTLR